MGWRQRGVTAVATVVPKLGRPANLLGAAALSASAGGPGQRATAGAGSQTFAEAPLDHHQEALL
jgi:hypothetical protein